MINIKEYSINKSVSKTAKSNKLILGDNKSLFDFSLFNTLLIPETEKQILIDSAIKNIRPSNRIDYYGKLFDQFTACDGIAKYNAHKVFSSTTVKLLYVIFELTTIEHYSKSRNSVYDNKYDVVEYKINSNTISPLNDIEIA